ncbi:MAG: hypothetical protein Q9210_004464 [Variospora velana]
MGKAIRTKASKAKKLVSAMANPDKVVKPLPKTRGLPKGKPQMVHGHDTIMSAEAEVEKQSFPFIRLPLELRHQIYGLALPHQEVSTGGWTTIVGTSNESMNLLLINQQILHEARSVLYGQNGFTMLISPFRILFLDFDTEVDLTAMLTTPSLPYIKNWQLALWPQVCNLDGIHYNNAVLSASAELAKIQGLRSLNLSVPCVCGHLGIPHIQGIQGGCWALYGNLAKVEYVHEMVVDILTPLNMLWFRGSVQIITTTKAARCCTHCPARFRESEARKDAIGLAGSIHRQCQHPPCLALAASFEPLRASLMSKSTPLSLTPKKAKWLESKQRATEIQSEKNDDMSQALRDVWDAIGSGSDDYFWKMLTYNAKDGKIISALRAPEPLPEIFDPLRIEPSEPPPPDVETSAFNIDKNWTPDAWGSPTICLAGGAMIFPWASYGFIRFELNGESDVKICIPAGRLCVTESQKITICSS